MGMANGPNLSDMPLIWKKSRHSGNGGNCVEVAELVKTG